MIVLTMSDYSNLINQGNFSSDFKSLIRKLNHTNNDEFFIFFTKYLIDLMNLITLN